MSENEKPAANATQYYCAVCAQPVERPLTCRDCHAVICRECGTPLELVDDLGMG